MIPSPVNRMTKRLKALPSHNLRMRLVIYKYEFSRVEYEFSGILIWRALNSFNSDDSEIVVGTQKYLHVFRKYADEPGVLPFAHRR